MWLCLNSSLELSLFTANNSITIALSGSRALRWRMLDSIFLQLLPLIQFLKLIAAESWSSHLWTWQLCMHLETDVWSRFLFDPLFLMHWVRANASEWYAFFPTNAMSSQSQRLLLKINVNLHTIHRLFEIMNATGVVDYSNKKEVLDWDVLWKATWILE